MSAKGAVEKIVITRLESERVRMRKSTDRGNDVALTLSPGSRLRHGDVVALSDRMMTVIEIEQEKVGVVRVSDARIAALVGHAIGNLHRPIKVEGDSIYFPIQSDDEVLMVKKQLAPLGDLDVTMDAIVFEPEAAARHEH
jgi:urease accessory protein